MASALLDQLGISGPPAGGGASAPADLPPSMPDPEPHLGPDAGADSAAGQPPDAGQDTPVDHAATTEVDALTQLLDMAQQYSSIPTVQPNEQHQMAKAVTIITGLLDANQKARDSITGANPALRKLPGASGA